MNFNVYKFYELTLILFFLFGCESIFAGEEDEYVIVTGVKSLAKLSSESRVSPWAKKSYESSNISKLDSEEGVLYSLGCNYYEVVYLAEYLSGLPYEITVRFQPGEFCDISRFMFAHPTLLELKPWEGKYYLKAFARAKFDHNDSLFITGYDVVKEMGLQHLYKNLGGIEEACEDLKYLSQIEQSRMLNDPTTNLVSSKYICYKKGVYINTIQKLKK